MLTDIVLGAVLELIAGLTFRVMFLRAWRFGGALPGSERAEVAVAQGRVSTRTAMRALVAALFASAFSVAAILALSLPVGSVVDVWPRFRWAWTIAFGIGALIATIAARRRVA
jgi:hypothetical protein